MNSYLKKFLELGAIGAVFMSSTLVPFATFEIFKFAFELEPQGFWRFTPATPVASIPVNWIIATIIANIIIAIVAVMAYSLFNKAINGSWLRKGLIFGSFSIFLGVYIPVWSMYTIMNLSGVTAICLVIDGTFEYMLYSLMIAFILRNKNTIK